MSALKRAPWPIPALVALALACGGDSAGPGDADPVATIALQGPAFVDVGDAVQFQATARDAAGATLAGAALTWRSLAPANASVDQNGRVTGHQPGEAVIEVVAENGVKATIPVQVTPVSAIQPDTGRYGAVIALEGSGFPANPEVSFTGVGSATVPAVVRSASGDRIEVWVPGGARTGPIHVRSGSTTFTTSRTFTLNAQEDVYASVSSTDLQRLPFPFYNPGLFAYGGGGTPFEPPAEYWFYFEVTEPTPFTLTLEDRGARQDTQSTLWALLIHATPPSGGSLWRFRNGLAWLDTRNYLEGAVVRDATRYSRQVLEPGAYWIIVMTAFGPNTPIADRSRPYGLRLEPSASFARPLDDFEPNDFPREARQVSLPFVGQTTRFENPWAFDHYLVEIEERSELRVTVADGPPEAFRLAFLRESESADLMLSDYSQLNGGAPAVELVANGLGPSIAATVDPGRYIVAVWEFAGADRDYGVEIVATPVQPEGEGAAAAAASPGSFDGLLRPGGAGRTELPAGRRARPAISGS